jgi:uncharacterized protein
MISGPFVVNTHDLGRRAGSMRELELTVTATEPFGSEVIAVPAGAPIELDLRLEAVSEGVLVTGTASAVATGECVRCLREVSEEVVVDLTELFAYPGTRHEREAAEEDEDPLPTLDGDLLDLETTVTDALVTALPFQPLCSPNCAGLCSVCGIRLDDAEPGHAHEVLDPRWAALTALATPEEQGQPGGGQAP